jgi:hypothetical protein
MAASKKRAKLAADLLGAGAAARAADLSKLPIVRRDRRAEAERLRVIENEELRSAEERGAPASADTLFYKKGSATAVTFRPHYWTYERHAELESTAEFAFESKAGGPRPVAPLRPLEVSAAEPEARPTQAQVTAALTAGLVAPRPAEAAVESAPASPTPASSQAAEVMVLPADWGALSPEKVAALLAERPPESAASAPAEPVAEPEPVPNLVPLPPKPTSEKIRKALLLLWPERDGSAAPVVPLPAAEAPSSEPDAAPAPVETGLAAEPPATESVAPPAEASGAAPASQPIIAAEPEPAAEVLAQPAAEIAAPAPEEPPAEILPAPEPAAAAELAEPEAPAPIMASSEPPQDEPAHTADEALAVLDEPGPENMAEAPRAVTPAPEPERVPWFAAEERISAEREPPVLEPAESDLLATAETRAAPTEPWPLPDAAEESAADAAEPRSEDQPTVDPDELGAAIESVLAQRWYGTGKAQADWKTGLPSLPTAVAVSESALIAELAQARGGDATVQTEAPAPEPERARSWGDRVLGFVCLAMVLAVGYFGYAIWGDQLLAALSDLLQ